MEFVETTIDLQYSPDDEKKCDLRHTPYTRFPDHHHGEKIEFSLYSSTIITLRQRQALRYCYNSVRLDGFTRAGIMPLSGPISVTLPLLSTAAATTTTTATAATTAATTTAAATTTTSTININYLLFIRYFFRRGWRGLPRVVGSWHVNSRASAGVATNCSYSRFPNFHIFHVRSRN